MNEEQNNEYESPEIFELGEAETLTQGHNFGNWPDGLDKWIFTP